MIGQFIALYRARKDPKLAKRIASEMIIDGAIERASWPLTLAKLWMGVGIAVMAGLAVLFILVGNGLHWALAIPALPFGGAIYGVIQLWRGINAGVEHVTQLAKTELGNKAAALKMPSRQSENTLNTP